jgi:hypothetical protein
MVNTSLTKLEPGECTPDKQTGKMSKALKEAYDIAEERHELDHFKNMLEEFMQQQKQAQEDEAAKQAEKEAKAAKKAEKAAADKTKEKKDRRKSKSKETVSDADDMDLDVPEGTEAKPTKKRKKEAESEGEGPKVRRHDSSRPHSELTKRQAKKTPKAPKVAASKTNGESAKKVTKPRKVVQKPADEEPVTEAEKLERREKAVLYLRHRLQKGFLMRDQAPKEEEMATMDDFFNQLEAYTNLEPAIIRGTKIYKVLRGVVKLSSIPKEEEYQFKKRSNDLLASWHEALGSKGDDKEDEKTEDNGEKSDKPEEAAEKPETKESTEAPSNTEAVEDKDVAMTDVKEDKVEVAPATDSETAAAE